jgi:hypothetical protein
MALAQTLLILLGLYFGLGLLFGLAFVLKGVGVIDPVARSGTLGFRLLIFPGAIALWPILAKRWLKPIPPQENNSHRRLAREL